MAIRIVCPHCQADFNVAETSIGKKLRCKSCDEAFTAEETEDEPVARKAGKAESNGHSRAGKSAIKAEKGESSRRKSAVDDEDEDRPRKRRKDDDDDDDDRKGRKSKPAGKKKGGAPVGLIIGLGVGGLVLLLVVGVVVILCTMEGEDPEIAKIRREKGDFEAELAKAFKQANKDIAQARKDNPQININFPDPKNMPRPGDFPDPNKVFGGDNPFAPKPEPTSVGEALKLLRGANLDDKNRAIRYLTKTEPNGPEQADVARELANLQGVNGVWGGENALIRWATAEQVPTLITIFEKTNELDDRRKEIMRTLGKLQDERGLEVIVSQLGNFFHGQAAQEALDKFGDKAKPKLVGLAFTKKNEARKQIQTALKKFNATNGEIAAQALMDLNSPENEVRNAVCEWLGQTEAVADQQAAISKALEGLLRNDSTRRAAAKGMKNWATADAIPVMGEVLNKEGGLPDGEANAFLRQALVRLKDPRRRDRRQAVDELL